VLYFAAGATQHTHNTSRIPHPSVSHSLTKVLASIQGGEDMWVLLGGAGLPDSQVRRVVDALRGNASITSVDLSRNQISEQGLEVSLA